MAPLIKGKRRLTRAPKVKQAELEVADEPEVDEPEVTPEPEVTEDEPATVVANTVTVIEKATGNTFEAYAIAPEPVDPSEPNGTQYTFAVVTGDTVDKYTETEFRRKFSPVGHSAAKTLREVSNG